MRLLKAVHLIIGKAKLGTMMALADGIIGKAKLGTMMALADGSPFRQPVKAFYQANGSDVTVTSWNPDALHLRTTEQLSLTL